MTSCPNKANGRKPKNKPLVSKQQESFIAHSMATKRCLCVVNPGLEGKAANRPKDAADNESGQCLNKFDCTENHADLIKKKVLEGSRYRIDPSPFSEEACWNQVGKWLQSFSFGLAFNLKFLLRQPFGHTLIPCWGISRATSIH